MPRAAARPVSWKAPAWCSTRRCWCRPAACRASSAWRGARPAGWPRAATGSASRGRGRPTTSSETAGDGAVAGRRAGDPRRGRRFPARPRRQPPQPRRRALGRGDARPGRRRPRLPAADGAAVRGRSRRLHAERVMSVYLYAVMGGRPRSACGSGICAEPLRLVAVGDFVALVGDVPGTPEISAMTLRAQDAVLRRLAAEVDAVLPARFGTLLHDDAALSDALARRRVPLAEALGRVAGCEQMTVRVWGDGAAPAPAAGGESGGGPGTRYLT